MSDIADRYARLSDAFAAKVAAVPADAWDGATPCEEWSVRDLVRHVVETPAMFFGLVGREMRPGPAVEDDAVAAFEAGREQVLADLRDPARAETWPTAPCPWWRRSTWSEKSATDCASASRRGSSTYSAA